MDYNTKWATPSPPQIKPRKIVVGVVKMAVINYKLKGAADRLAESCKTPLLSGNRGYRRAQKVGVRWAVGLYTFRVPERPCFKSLII